MEAGGERRIQATFCFVDLAGYTALTEVHGDEAAADLIDRFVSLVERVVDGRGVLVDVIGDAVLLQFPDPAAAVAAVTDLYRLGRQEPHFPILRAGLHHGAVLVRGGRYVGTTLNLAARIAAEAQGGQALATGAVAEAARGEGIRTSDLGARRFKNLTAAVDLFELHLEEARGGHLVDPVCRMRVTEAGAAGMLRFAGRAYWFCSLHCAGLFAAGPERYLDAAVPGAAPRQPEA